MLSSPFSIPNTLWTNLVLAFAILIFIGLAAFILWPDPKTARKIKNKMTWHLVTTIEKESIDKETRLENLKIRDWNQFIKKEYVTKDPTYDDVFRHRPHIRFKTKSPVQKWGEELTSDFSYQDGDTWSMDDPSFDWNGDPENVAPGERLNSVIHIVPSDKDYSFTTTEIWHYRLCNKKQLKEEGKDHEHTGMCELINSVKHVTWHIRKG
ncbi:hypothetical protein [Rothia aeria]|uniref:hypothetical protein n=1 Tax=Rothia aeria TaxID=172042 RepID=UPI002430F3A1|nr:hypothetical protein [Rothia aeria]